MRLKKSKTVIAFSLAVVTAAGCSRFQHSRFNSSASSLPVQVASNHTGDKQENTTFADQGSQEATASLPARQAAWPEIITLCDGDPAPDPVVLEETPAAPRDNEMQWAVAAESRTTDKRDAALDAARSASIDGVPQTTFASSGEAKLPESLSQRSAASSSSPRAIAYSHAPDYSWLVGELYFVHSRQSWHVRYSPLDETDRYGGSVRLVGTGPMKRFKSGELVRVHGYISRDSTDNETVYHVTALRSLNQN
ncbi:MAG: hypothetical protein KatS3mg105_2380 [Gemmatales bacterium]|nr:MAG: hypothetical protein KatS3mg105_2380 [Gemmatales bacterium]